ncbi:hypothetical protein V1509DRAFT_641239 [Lipomyces kononenkoae]
MGTGHERGFDTPLKFEYAESPRTNDVYSNVGEDSLKPACHDGEIQLVRNWYGRRFSSRGMRVVLTDSDPR